MRILKGVLLVFVTLLILTILSCDGDNPVSLSNKNIIETGKPVELGGATIGTSGGTVKIEASGTVLDGLELEISENSFSTSQRFDFKLSEIKNHK
jgi:hypothetical protein